jgi:septum formation topological specificity factor MinE
MKKLSAKAFEKRYLTLIFSLLGVFIVSLIAATITGLIPNMPIWITLMLVGVGVLSIGIIFVLGKKYKGRMVNIQHEIEEETFQKHLIQDLPIPLTWTVFQEFKELCEGESFRITPEGVFMGEETILWHMVSSFKATRIDQEFQLVLTFDREDGSAHFKTIMSGVVIKLIEHYSDIKLDESEINQAQDEHLSIIQSEIVWGHNRLLQLEKIGFISLISVIGLGIGILMGIYVTHSSIGITVANLIIIPNVLIVYPNRYKDYPKSSYLMNKKVIGYARGRKVLILPFEKIDSMSYDHRKLYINLTDLDKHGNPMIFYIPRDSYLIDRLKEHLTLYQIDKQVIKL